MTRTREVTRSQTGQDGLLFLPAGEVVLRDEAAKTERTVAVTAFELGACPVTRER